MTARALLVVVPGDIFAQGAIDAGLVALAIRRAIFKPGNQIGIEAQSQLLLDGAEQHAAPCDTLVVTRIDRLARLVKDLQDIVHELRAKGVTLKTTEQPIDTSTAARKGIPGHAGRVRGVRDEPSEGAAIRGDCRG